MKIGVILLFACSWLTTSSQPLRIDLQSVAHAQAQIAQELQRTRYAQTGLVAATAATAAILAYKVAHSYFNPQPQDIVPDILLNYPDLGSASWLARVGKVTRDLLVSGLVSRATFSWGEAAVSWIVKKRDIAWFLSSHTSLSYVLNELPKLYHTLASYTHQHDDAYYAYTSASSYLVDTFKCDLEKLVGFIHYQATQVDDARQRAQLTHHAQLIINQADALLSTLDDHSTVSFDQKAGAVAQFQDELTRACTRCAHVLEGVRWTI